MTKPSELRKKTNEELEIELRELREKLHNVTYQHMNRQLDDTNMRKKLKRSIARHLTILRERELSGSEEE